MSTSTPAATAAATSAEAEQSKITAALQRWLPSGKGWIASGLTAGLLYLGNHVFKVPVLDTSTVQYLTPLISLVAGSIANEEKTVETKVAAVLAPTIVKVEGTVEKDPALTLLETQVESLVKTNPAFKATLLRVIASELDKVPALTAGQQLLKQAEALGAITPTATSEPTPVIPVPVNPASPVA